MTEVANFLLCPCGSAGDVYPFVGLAKSLQARGHRVTILTSGYFRELIEEQGILFFDTLPKEQFELLLRDPDLWHPRRGPTAVFRAITQPLFEAGYRTILDHYRSGVTVVAGSVLALSAAGWRMKRCECRWRRSIFSPRCFGANLTHRNIPACGSTHGYPAG